MDERLLVAAAQSRIDGAAARAQDALDSGCDVECAECEIMLINEFVVLDLPGRNPGYRRTVVVCLPCGIKLGANA